jgi:hypothetical protein
VQSTHVAVYQVKGQARADLSWGGRVDG